LTWPGSSYLSSGLRPPHILEQCRNWRVPLGGILTSHTPTEESKKMRVTSKGQVTIPVEVREKLGLLPDTEVDFIVSGDSVRIVKRGSQGAQNRGTNIVRRLSGTGTVRMSTDEILALTRKP
jgi:AbrB family looped-hinge helix DNA binding protein